MRRLVIAGILFFIFIIGCYYLFIGRLDLSRYFAPTPVQEPENFGLEPPASPPVWAPFKPQPVTQPTASKFPKARGPHDSARAVYLRPHLRTPLPLPTMPQITPVPVPSFQSVTPPPLEQTPVPINAPTYAPVPGSSPGTKPERSSQPEATPTP